MREVNYQRHVDSGDQHRADDTGDGRRTQRCHREFHFPFLPERYEPLVDEEERAKLKEERKKRKKKQYKKVRKPVGSFLPQEDMWRHRQWCSWTACLHNVGKALRVTWKCLVLGLYNFALGYSTPITVASTFAPDFHMGRNSS